MSEQVTFRTWRVVLGRALLMGVIGFAALFLAFGARDALHYALWYAAGGLVYGIVFGQKPKGDYEVWVEKMKEPRNMVQVYPDRERQTKILKETLDRVETKRRKEGRK